MRRTTTTTYPNSSLRGGLFMKEAVRKPTASSRSKAKKAELELEQMRQENKKHQSLIVPSPFVVPSPVGLMKDRASHQKSPTPRFHRTTTPWFDPDLLIKRQEKQQQQHVSPLLQQVSISNRPMPRPIGQFTPTVPHTHNPSFVSPIAHQQQTNLARRLFANGLSPVQLQFTQMMEKDSDRDRDVDIDKTMIFKENEKVGDDEYKRAVSASKKFILPIKPYNADNFIFHRHLGNGSFGHVWLVSKADDHEHKELVLKKMNKKKDGTINPTSLAALMRELVALRHLQAVCQNYLVCYDGFFEDDSHFYITTNYIAGMKELRQVIDSHRLGEFKLSDAILKNIINNLIEGLALIHNHDVAHRDVKPANILVNPNNGQIRYVDFGLACWSDECLDDKHIKGTLNYLAPDIYPVSARRTGFTLKQLQAGDIWSLGATIWELLDGESVAKVWTRSVRELSQYLGCRGFELLKFPENFRYVDFPMGEFSWKSIMVEKELAHLPEVGPKIKTLKPFFDLDWTKRIAAFDYLVYS